VLARGYKKYDISAMGQFDVSLLLNQYVSAEQANSLTPQWRGGYYWAARAAKGQDKSNNTPVDTASIAMVYVSRWAGPEAASQFAGAYAAGLTKRYRTVQKLTVAAILPDKPPAGGSEPAPNAADNGPAALTEPTTFTTEEGPVIIVPSGNMLVITESFDPETAGKIRDAVLKGSDHGPIIQ